MIKIKDTYIDLDGLAWVCFISETAVQLLGAGFNSTFHDVPAADIAALRDVMEWKRQRYPLWQKKADLDVRYSIQSTEEMLDYQRQRRERQDKATE